MSDVKHERPWTAQEIDVFFYELKVNLRSFAEIAKILRTRTEAEVRVLYSRHATYLSLPQADIQVFRSIVVDAQKRSQPMAQTAPVQPTAAASTTNQVESGPSPLMRRKSAQSAFAPPAKRSKVAQTSKKRQRSSRRKKSSKDDSNAAFSPDEHDAGRVLSMLSSLSPPTQGVGQGHEEEMKNVALPRSLISQQNIPKPQSSAILSAIRDRPASALHGLPSGSDMGDAFLPPEMEFSPLKETYGHRYDLSILKEDEPVVGQRVCDLMITELNTRMERARTSRAQRYWIYHLFYPVVDQLYFAHNPLRFALNYMGFRDDVRRPTRSWNHIRRLLPSPRLFSKTLCKEERKLLGSYRNYARRVQNTSVDVETNVHRTVEGIPRLLRNEEKVWAFHSATSCLHEARIVASGPGFYELKFNYPHLGKLRVKDVGVMNGDLKICSIPKLDYPANLAESIGLDMNTYDAKAIDVFVLAKLLKFLDRKEVLMSHLEYLMNYCRNLKQTNGVFSEDLKYQVAWVIFEIERSNMELESSLMFLRSRKMPLLKLDIKDTSLQSFELLKESRVKAQQALVNLQIMLPPRNEISSLILHSISLIILIRDCAVLKVPPTFIEDAVQDLRPQCAENAEIFDSLVNTIRMISQNLLIPSN